MLVYLFIPEAAMGFGLAPSKRMTIKKNTKNEA